MYEPMVNKTLVPVCRENIASWKTEAKLRIYFQVNVAVTI
jgi:hypothetical protein